MDFIEHMADGNWDTAAKRMLVSQPVMTRD